MEGRVTAHIAGLLASNNSIAKHLNLTCSYIKDIMIRDHLKHLKTLKHKEESI